MEHEGQSSSASAYSRIEEGSVACSCGQKEEASYQRGRNVPAVSSTQHGVPPEAFWANDPSQAISLSPLQRQGRCGVILLLVPESPGELTVLRPPGCFLDGMLQLAINGKVQSVLGRECWKSLSLLTGGERQERREGFIQYQSAV